MYANGRAAGHRIRCTCTIARTTPAALRLAQETQQNWWRIQEKKWRWSLQAPLQGPALAVRTRGRGRGRSRRRLGSWDNPLRRGVDRARPSAGGL